jgi:hypothetical protein
MPRIARNLRVTDMHHIVIPAKAGTHFSAARAVARWITACAGMTIGMERFEMGMRTT